MTEKEDQLDDLFFTEEGKLRHENKFLKERVANLETFKKNFFSLQSDLIEAKEKLSILEDQRNLGRIKDRIIADTEELESVASEKGQVGDILEFFHESITAASFQDLIMSLFQSIDGLDLDMAVQIKNKKNVLSYALDQSTKDANVALINRHISEGEIIEQDAYIVINHRYISLVANKLPVSEPIKNRQIKEYLEIIAVGANTRIDTLSKKLELEELRRNIYQIFRKTNQSFETIQNNMDGQIISISELFINFEQQLRDTLARMKLSEDYQKLFHLIITDAKSELNLLLTSSLALDEHFMSVMKKLEKAYSPDSHGHL